MKRLMAYLKEHRREKVSGIKLVLAAFTALTAAVCFLGYENAARVVLGGLWCVSALVYLYQAFFATPGEKTDYAAESDQAEADLTAALAECDDAALRKIIDDPLRGEAIKARAKALLAERE